LFASRRLTELPPYFFAALDARVAELRAAGRPVIDLGRADPDHDAPPAAVEALGRAARDPATHHYPPLAGLPELRRAVARWYLERHGVVLDPEREVLILGGAKEGLFLLSLAVCDPGDVVLVPDPSFPAYRMGAYFAGAEVVSLPLRPELGYLPDLTGVAEAVARRARLLFLNYPNNPTGATAPPRLFQEALAFGRRHGCLVCNDFAYGDLGYDGYRPPSLLATEGARAQAVEFITFSKAFCMPGWRLGAAVGNADALGALFRVLAEVGSGVFAAVQLAGVAALEQAGRPFLVARSETYRARRDVMVAALEEVGLRVQRPRATPYLWLPTPDGWPSSAYAEWLLEQAGLALAPGSAFGAGGEGFLRLSLTAPTAEVEEAAARLRSLGPAGIRPPARGKAPAREGGRRPSWRGGAAGGGPEAGGAPAGRRIPGRYPAGAGSGDALAAQVGTQGEADGGRLVRSPGTSGAAPGPSGEPHRPAGGAEGPDEEALLGSL
jgi:aspartate/methionine/tyrosine aminotransferase